MSEVYRPYFTLILPQSMHAMLTNSISKTSDAEILCSRDFICLHIVSFVGISFFI